MQTSTLYDKVYGSLIGGLMGDAMGAPSEGMTWQAIKEKFGQITEFNGAGTDDSAIKQILCEAIITNGGHATADEFAASFLRNKKFYKLFYIPVRNMFHKIESGLATPVDAGYGNMHSSSTAMVISPIGIINACNPRQAAAEAYDVAGLIHAGPSGFCRDAACAVAAMVAEAMKPSPTVDSILNAATAYLHETSAKIIKEEIARVMEAAKRIKNYEGFREWFYANCLRDIISDSRETVPCVMALLYLAEGDPERVMVYSANFGRDADTIGTLAGAIAGAYKGASGIRQDWVKIVEAASNTLQASSSDYGMEPVVLPDQNKLTEKLVEVIAIRRKEGQDILDLLKTIA
jgi:ADP-ribosylglycohydrolase